MVELNVIGFSCLLYSENLLIADLKREPGQEIINHSVVALMVNFIDEFCDVINYVPSINVKTFSA